MNEQEPVDVELPAGEYCRRIEAHLCQKNAGHLVRLVGPAFEAVCRWHALGVPLKVAFRGIDRYCERYYAKGPRRRPVRVEFCEADVLDTFDGWRRALGVPLGPSREAGAGPDGPLEPGHRRGPALGAHLDRVLLKLSSFLAGVGASPSLRALVEQHLREIDAMRSTAKALRGEARSETLGRLRRIDEAVMARALTDASPETLAELRGSAEDELRAFHARMSEAAWCHAVEASMREALRDRLGLPRIALE